jgi:hypothetical protein
MALKLIGLYVFLILLVVLIYLAHPNVTTKPDSSCVKGLICLGS